MIILELFYFANYSHMTNLRNHNKNHGKQWNKLFISGKEHQNHYGEFWVNRQEML
jgi:hypothetical protein